METSEHTASCVFTGIEINCIKGAKLNPKNVVLVHKSQFKIQSYSSMSDANKTGTEDKTNMVATLSGVNRTF